jgi:hypothetical protein
MGGDFEFHFLRIFFDPQLVLLDVYHAVSDQRMEEGFAEKERPRERQAKVRLEVFPRAKDARVSGVQPVRVRLPWIAGGA